MIRETLCVGERMLAEQEVREIEVLEQSYLREEFIKMI